MGVAVHIGMIIRKLTAFLSEVRKLIFAGREITAEKLWKEHAFTKQNGMPYQTVGSLKLHFPGHEKYTDYYRDLNIENAVATVSYKVGDVTYTRTLFTSLADNALIIHLEADRPHSIAFEASYSTPFEESAVIASKNRLNFICKSFCTRRGSARFVWRVRRV